jgi:hypothetical protein
MNFLWELDRIADLVDYLIKVQKQTFVMLGCLWADIFGLNIEYRDKNMNSSYSFFFLTTLYDFPKTVWTPHMHFH